MCVTWLSDTRRKVEGGRGSENGDGGGGGGGGGRSGGGREYVRSADCCSVLYWKASNISL